MYGVMLILVLAVMGGAIAFIGDRLGTKVGKKKISLFGLRPRHTSMVMTVITGILIVTSTLGVMTVASKDVRTALFGMEQLKKEITALAEETQEKGVQLVKARSDLAEKNKEVMDLDKNIANTQQKLMGIAAELHAVTSERDRIQTALSETSERYDSAQAELRAAEASVAKLEQSKKTLEADLTRLNETAEQLRKGLTTVREGQVIYQAGEAIGRAVLPSGRTSEESRRDLGEFLSMTNNAIIEKLQVADKQMMVLWVSQTDYDHAISALATATVNQAVRVVAESNIVLGEPVIARLELYPNYLIYNKGALLYEERFSSLRAADAENAVISVLSKVNQQAVRDGVLSDPLAGTVGLLKASEVFDAIQAVRQENSTVRVAVYAKKDIYTVGPMEIVIRVSTVM